MKLAHSAIVIALASSGACLASSETDELGAASALFSGGIEVAATDPEFHWLEGPVWSNEGNYLLFSDVKWVDENGIACGMIWKLDAEDNLSKFLKCSGLVGPGEPPADLLERKEAGGNGLAWGWGGESDLLICQHGMGRIVRLDPSSVVDGEIDDDAVSIVIDEFNSTSLNSPNDLWLERGELFFTDPPFGLQMADADDPLAYAYEIAPQVPAVYKIPYDPAVAVDGTSAETIRLRSFERSATEGPNGVIFIDGDLINPITNFDDPRVEIFGGDEVTKRLELEYRIEGENASNPPLTDGSTYDKDLDVLFIAGPGGVYMYKGQTGGYHFLGFLRVDDLVANVAVGGDYLWITANKRLLRVKLANGGDKESSTPSGCGRMQSEWLFGFSAMVAFYVIMM